MAVAAAVIQCYAFLALKDVILMLSVSEHHKLTR